MLRKTFSDFHQGFLTTGLALLLGLVAVVVQSMSLWARGVPVPYMEQTLAILVLGAGALILESKNHHPSPAGKLSSAVALVMALAGASAIAQLLIQNNPNLALNVFAALLIGGRPAYLTAPLKPAGLAYNISVFALANLSVIHPVDAAAVGFGTSAIVFLWNRRVRGQN